MFSVEKNCLGGVVTQHAAETQMREVGEGGGAGEKRAGGGGDRGRGGAKQNDEHCTNIGMGTAENAEMIPAKNTPQV